MVKVVLGVFRIEPLLHFLLPMLKRRRWAMAINVWLVKISGLVMKVSISLPSFYKHKWSPLPTDPAVPSLNRSMDLHQSLVKYVLFQSGN